MTWRAVNSTDDVLDFNALVCGETVKSTAYAVCYLRSEAAQRGIRMLVGCADEAKVYLNGRPVYRCADARAYLADQETVPGLTLNAGLNVLVETAGVNQDAPK